MKDRRDHVASQQFRLRHTHFAMAENAVVEAYPNNPEVRAGGLKLALRALGWEIETNQSGSIIELSLVRQRAAEEPLFAALGPFVDAGGFIEFTNEECDRWRYFFDGTNAHRQEGRVVYGDAPEGPQSVPPDRLSEVAPEPREWLRQAGSLGPDEEPPYGSPTLRQKARFAEEAVSVYAVRTGLDLDADGRETAVKDLLTDLMHFCDQEDLDFEDLLSGAQGFYDEEINGED